MTDEQQAKEMEEKISRLQACQDKLDNLELYATAKVGSVTVTRIPEGLIYGVGSTAVFVRDNEEKNSLYEKLEVAFSKYLDILSAPAPSNATAGWDVVGNALKDQAAPKKAATKKAAPKKVATKK